MSTRSTRVSAAVLFALLLTTGASGAAIEEARPSDEGWLGRFWREHRYHLLAVFLLEEADGIYEERFGPPDSPRLFGSPSGLDRSLAERRAGSTGATSFMAANKSSIGRILALGAISWASAGDWQGALDDVIGLVEAHKISGPPRAW